MAETDKPSDGVQLAAGLHAEYMRACGNRFLEQAAGV